MIDRTALEAALARAEPLELFSLAGELQYRAWAKLSNGQPEKQGPPELLEPGEAARLVGVNQRWLLEKTRGMSFRRDLGHKTKRFEKDGLLLWARTLNAGRIGPQ